MFRTCNTNELALAFTPAVLKVRGPPFRDGPPTALPFGSSLTASLAGSRLTMLAAVHFCWAYHSAWSSDRLDAGSLGKFLADLSSSGDGGLLLRQLSTRRLPLAPMPLGYCGRNRRFVLWWFFHIEQLQVQPHVAPIIYRSKLNAKIDRNFEVFDPVDFLAVLSQHIPDKGVQMIRYYGLYSNKARGCARKGTGHSHSGGHLKSQLSDRKSLPPVRRPRPSSFRLGNGGTSSGRLGMLTHCNAPFAKNRCGSSPSSTSRRSSRKSSDT